MLKDWLAAAMTTLALWDCSARALPDASQKHVAAAAAACALEKYSFGPDYRLDGPGLPMNVVWVEELGATEFPRTAQCLHRALTEDGVRAIIRGNKLELIDGNLYHLPL